MAESRRSGGMVAGAIVVGLVLVGAGVGIGAAIWSGGSDARTVTVTPQANAADENAAPASGNFAQAATIHVQYDTGEATVPMKLSQGQPTNCTRDETYGSFDMANKGTKQI